jgi:hypothetical protein
VSDLIFGPGRYATRDGRVAVVERVDDDMRPYPARGYVLSRNCSTRHRGAWALDGRYASACPRGGLADIVGLASEAERQRGGVNWEWLLMGGTVSAALAAFCVLIAADHRRDDACVKAGGTYVTLSLFGGVCLAPFAVVVPAKK